MGNPLLINLQNQGRIPSSINPALDRLIGGGHVGYNWQIDRYVLGVEADLSSGMDGRASAVGNRREFSISQTNSLEWIGTVRGRAGWLWTPDFLIFGSGGFAYGSAKASSELSVVPTPANFCPDNVFCGSKTERSTLAGWVAGAGLEYALDRQWHFKLEYLHFDLGELDYTIRSDITNALNGTAIMNATASFRGDIVRVGLSYKFD